MKIFVHFVLSVIASFWFGNPLFSQFFENSNLPIVIINTNGQNIVDEPKITANLKVIDGPEGERNRLHSEVFQYDGFAGVELRGQSSLALFPKKGLGIEIRDANGMDLDTSILGMPSESDWVIHSPYSDKSLIRNALAYHLAGEFMPYAPRVRMAELVINGDYQGVILWTEKIKRDKNRVNISKLNADENQGDDLTGGYILRFDKERPGEVGWESPYDPIVFGSQKTRFLYHYPKPEDITGPQKQYIRLYITEFEDVLMSEEWTDPVNGYEKYIDVESFVSTFIINELTRNVDGYRLSTYMFKDKDSKGGKLNMGPTWDHNLAWGNANYCNGSDVSGWGFNFNQVCPEDYWANHVWWTRLMAAPGFRQRIKDRWSELRNGVLNDDVILGKIDSLVALLAESSARNFVRWPVLNQYVWPNEYVGQTYMDEIEYLKDWVQQRTAWLDNNFGNLTTAVNNIDEIEDVRIFPNPSRDHIFIESSDKISRIEVFAMNGQLLQSRQIDQLSAKVDLQLDGYSGWMMIRLTKVNGDVIFGKIAKVKG